MDCITSVDGIKVWLLMSLVNKLIQVMTLLLMKTLKCHRSVLLESISYCCLLFCFTTSTFPWGLQVSLTDILLLH